MNDPIDPLLDEPQPYLEDAGFTARVMGALPPRRSRSARTVVLTGAALAATAALALGPARSGVSALFSGRFEWAVLATLALAVVVGTGTMISAVLREADLA